MMPQRKLSTRRSSPRKGKRMERLTFKLLSQVASYADRFMEKVDIPIWDEYESDSESEGTYGDNQDDEIFSDNESITSDITGSHEEEEEEIEFFEDRKSKSSLFQHELPTIISIRSTKTGDENDDKYTNVDLTDNKARTLPKNTPFLMSPMGQSEFSHGNESSLKDYNRAQNDKVLNNKSLKAMSNQWSLTPSTAGSLLSTNQQSQAKVLEKEDVKSSSRKAFEEARARFSPPRVKSPVSLVTNKESGKESEAPARKMTDTDVKQSEAPVSAKTDMKVNEPVIDQVGTKETRRQNPVKTMPTKRIFTFSPHANKAKRDAVHNERNEREVSIAEESSKCPSFDTQARQELANEIVAPVEEFEITFDDCMSVQSTKSTTSNVFAKWNLWETAHVTEEVTSSKPDEFVVEDTCREEKIRPPVKFSKVSKRWTRKNQEEDDDIASLLSNDYQLDNDESVKTSKSKSRIRMSSLKSKIRSLTGKRPKYVSNAESFAVSDFLSHEDEIVKPVEYNSIIVPLSTKSVKISVEQKVCEDMDDVVETSVRTPKNPIPLAIRADSETDSIEATTNANSLITALKLFDSMHASSNAEPQVDDVRDDAIERRDDDNRREGDSRYRVFPNTENNEFETSFMDFSMNDALQGLDSCKVSNKLGEKGRSTKSAKHAAFPFLARGRKLFHRKRVLKEEKKNEDVKTQSQKAASSPSSVLSFEAKSQQQPPIVASPSECLKLDEAEAKVHRRLHEDLMILAAIERKKIKLNRPTSTRQSDPEEFVRKVEHVIRKRMLHDNKVTSNE